MNSDSKVLEYINEKAQKVVDENISRAESEAKSIIENAKAEAKANYDKVSSSLKATYEQIIDRKIAVANLDAKKILMSAKSEALSNVFEKAIDECANLDKKEYLKLIAGMIKSSAKDGDVIVICENDKKRITKAFVDKIAKEMNIKLSLSDEFGDFKGGILISNPNMDKNLTLEVEFEAIKEMSNTDLLARVVKE